MKMFRFLFAAITLTAATATYAADAEPKAADDAKALPDLLNDAIEPFVPGTERARFLTAAGVDSELNEAEFEANAKAKEPFVRMFDKWGAALRFDKNANKTLDWYEAEAYRRDLQARMLAQFDTNKNKKLEGAEREEANKLLASGRLPRMTPQAAAPRGEDDDRPRRGRGEERRREMLEKWDTDGDGDLSRAETKEMIAAGIVDERKKIVSRWDDNGDGVLDDSERAKVMEDRQAQWWLRFDDIGMQHFDADRDGKLSDDESRDIVAFGEKLETLGKSWEVKLLDGDGDGEVSRDERRDMRSRMQLIGISMLPEAMKWVDTDGDGRPSRQEMEAVALRVATKGKQELDQWVKRYDRNNDGRLDNTERDDFVKGIDEDINDRFKRNDKDNDGKLSDNEIRSILEELAEEYDVKPKQDTF